MARSVNKNTRIYIDGFDLSGYVQGAPSLSWGFDPNEWAAATDPVNGVLPGRADIRVGSFNAVVDNTATVGLHAALSSADAVRNLMVALGMTSAPAAGAPVFCAQLTQLDYRVGAGDGLVPVTIDFGGWDERGDSKAYGVPWGYLLHANSAETAANSADAADHDAGASSALGGFMMYQVFSSDGSVAIKVQDSDAESNGDYSDLLTSGDVDASSAPVSGVVALAADATVERYLRWQIALNTATTVTFALGFVRGIL